MNELQTLKGAKCDIPPSQSYKTVTKTQWKSSVCFSYNCLNKLTSSTCEQSFITCLMPIGGISMATALPWMSMLLFPAYVPVDM